MNETTEDKRMAEMAVIENFIVVCVCVWWRVKKKKRKNEKKKERTSILIGINIIFKLSYTQAIYLNTKNSQEVKAK